MNVKRPVTVPSRRLRQAIRPDKLRKFLSRGCAIETSSKSELALDQQFLYGCQASEDCDVFAFLAKHPHATLDEQLAVLLVDQSRAWRGGRRRLVEEYLEQLPALRARPDLIAQLAIEEFGYRQERGEPVSASEYQSRFPACTDLLQSLSTNLSSGGVATDSFPTAGDSTFATAGPGKSNDLYATIPAPTSAATPGDGTQQIGDYEILGEIARGGMGVVYKARHVRLGSLAAVKLIRSGEFADEHEIQRFQTEARAAAQLSHAGIVSVHQVGEHAGQHFLAMAYVDGQSLWQRVKESPLEPKLAAKLMQQVAEAIQYAHDKGIIHRDLKPQNILLDASDQPKVTDFGLAKNQTGDSSLTASGEVLGTPSYMPPEQATGKLSQVGPLADIYSLGATLYCLLTGRPPFQAANRLETLLQVVEQEPVPPRQLNRSVPADLETICLKCLEKDPAKRYASATALAAELGRFQRDEPILARPVSRVEHAWRWCRRNPLVAGLSTSAVILLISVATVSTLAYFRETQLVSEKDGLIQEKDGLIKDKDTLIGEKEGLILQKDQLATKEQTKSKELAEEVLRTKAANKDALYKLYISKLAQASAELAADNTKAAELALETVPFEQRRWEFNCLWRQVEGTPLTLRGPVGQVECVSFHPNGTQIASTAPDGAIKIWDLRTGQQLRTIRGVDATSVEFSPDGTRIASGSIDQSIKLWDFETGRELKSLRGHTSRVHSVEFSSDGIRLVSMSFDNTVKIWNTVTGATLHTFQGHAHGVAAASFSPDGKQLATVSPDAVKVWDAERGAEIRTIEPEPTPGYSGPQSVSFSPDGTRLAVGCGAGMIRLYDSQSGTEIRAIRGLFAFSNICFSPDGARLAGVSAFNEKTVQIWEAQTGVELQSFRGHTERVLFVSFSPDGTQIASASQDGTVKLWNTQTGAELNVRDDIRGIAALSFNPSGTLLASANGDHTVELWNVQTGEVFQTLHGHSNSVTSVVFSPDGSRLASGSIDQTIKIWNVHSGAELHTLRGHMGPVNSLSFSFDGTRIASGCDDGTVKLWESETGRELHALPSSTGIVSHVRFSPDGSRLACWYDSIHLRDARTGAELQTVRSNLVRSVSFSPNGSRIAGGDFDGTIRIWDADTGDKTHTLRGHTNIVDSLSFNHDGTLLASGCIDGAIKVWDTRAGTELLTIHITKGFGTSVCFSPDGTRLVCGIHTYSVNGIRTTIKVWDGRIGTDYRILRGHNQSVKSARFNRDGTRLVTREREQNFTDDEKHHGEPTSGKALVWKLPEGELLPDDPVPEDTELTEQSPNPLLSALIPISDVYLIRRNPDYDPWAEDFERRRKMAPKWHAEAAQQAETSNNYYAAAFHLGWLLKSEPDDADLKTRRDQAVAKLKEQGILPPPLPRAIQPEGKPELPTQSVPD